MYSGGLLLGAAYLLVGLSFWGHQRPVEVAAPAPAADISLLREQLAQQLFCEVTPCPEPAPCPAQPAWWLWIAAVGLGFLLGLAAASCCCGSALAGFAFSRRSPVVRGSIRALPPSTVTW